MRYTIMLLLALIGAPPVAEGAESVFCGRSLGHHFIEGVKIPCPENAICLDSWFRWRLSAEKVLSGPDVPKQISAATIQHAQYAPRYEKNLQIFTVKPIEDENTRRMLGADYILLKFSPSDDKHAWTCAESPE